MNIDDRIMDKVLDDVKEIIAEPDGTVRFIFYSPYSEETYEDSELEAKENVIEGLRGYADTKDEIIEELESEIKRLRSINNSKINEIKELKSIITNKENYITELMSENNNKTTSIALLEQKLAGGKND